MGGDEGSLEGMVSQSVWDFDLDFDSAEFEQLVKVCVLFYSCRQACHIRCPNSDTPLALLQEQSPPPRPEAYPIPTQTYTREYFTFPASRAQDRMVPPPNQWPNYEDKGPMLSDGGDPHSARQVR